MLSITLKAVQLAQYYNRTFSAIPVMIVDKADIVSYSKDTKTGKMKTIIDFDRFAYYEVVKCNRQKIGLHKSAQGGVEDYNSWGCGDAADLNADIGREWMALCVNRSAAKGNPILVDSLILLTGKDSENTPKNCNGCLHMFGSTSPVKIDNDKFSFRADKEGMYLYRKGDAAAYTASAFNAGYLALAAIGGLAPGIVGTTAVMLPKLRKKKAEVAG